MTAGPHNPASAPTRYRLAWAVLGAVAFLAVVLVLVWGLAMRRGLNHDEHQFVASGALIAREGLLPYRDFPYFHVPTLSLIYALLFRGTDSLLLAARSVAVAAGFGTLALLMAVALTWLRAWRPALRLWAGAVAVLLLIGSAGFLHAAGRAWNHDVPVFLMMAAACLMGVWIERAGRQSGWLLGAGVLLGLAAGTRSSFALAALPFAIAVPVVLPWRSVRTWAALGLLVLGGVIGLLPTIVLFSAAPDRFIFGNLTYARLNTAWYSEFGPPGTAMGLGGKLWATLLELGGQPGNLLLVLVAGLAVWQARAALANRSARWLWLLLALLPLLLAGAFLPTPLQAQYLYPLLPLAALILVVALRYDPNPRLTLGVASGAALLALGLAAPRYWDGATIALTPGEWYPAKLHTRGQLLAHLASGERTLTLAPIFPLEGGAPVYPEFVTGPLALRVAPLLPAADQARFGMVGPAALEADLAAQPPRAILTGVHADDAEPEQPLLDYAQAHGYTPIPLPEEGVLWVSPLATWADQIRLGAVDLPAEPVAAGSEVVLTFYLQAVQTPTTNYNVLVRLVAPDGSDLARSEGWPWGKPTSQWPAGEMWPDGHTLQLPADARPGPYRVEIGFYDPATLDLLGDGPVNAGYVVVAAPQATAPGAPLATFGDCIELLAADIPPIGWTGGAEQTVRLTWQRNTQPCGDLTVFVHLAGANGLLAQRDQPPLQGFYPTGAWLPGVPVTDEYVLTLPPDAAPGDAQLLVGLYDPATGARLPATQNGRSAGDAFPAGQVTIQ